VIPARTARVATLALVTLGLLGMIEGDLGRGDEAWTARAVGATDGRPLPGPIQDSIRAYEDALAQRPESLSARWKLLRSLHFAGRFLSGDADEQRSRYERAARIAAQGQDQLAASVGRGEPLDALPSETLRARLAEADVAPIEVARLYFWSAINWGSWSRTVGLLDAVQQGVANRLHRYAEVTLALEPDYEGGGAYRLLGRLHAKLPRVPFLSGWVDRELALPLVERGLAIAPDHPGNRLLLALTLIELAPERRVEALGLLEAVDALTPRPTMRIEDLAIRDEAREQLAALRELASR